MIVGAYVAARVVKTRESEQIDRGRVFAFMWIGARMQDDGFPVTNGYGAYGLRGAPSSAAEVYVHVDVRILDSHIHRVNQGPCLEIDKERAGDFRL